MAGHIAFLSLKKTGKYDLTSVVYRNKLTADCIVADVTDKSTVEKLIRTIQPDYIVNCIGILIKGSVEYPDNAIFLNAYFPHLLARLADENGASLIHISTDCVFSGKKGDYSETDTRDADDTYGKSKGLGEVISDRHLTIRTSIIGPEIKKEGEGLFHWFMSQYGEIKGFTEAFWGGVTTVQLAIAIEAAIENNLKGLVHLTNGQKIAKYDLVNLFKEIWKKEEVTIEAAPGKAVDKSLLKSSKFDFEVPGYREMLQEQKAWMDDHSELYEKIYG